MLDIKRRELDESRITKTYGVLFFGENQDKPSLESNVNRN